MEIGEHPAPIVIDGVRSDWHGRVRANYDRYVDGQGKAG